MKFLEQEVVQANAKIERVTTKKLDDVISSHKRAFQTNPDCDILEEVAHLEMSLKK